MKLSATLNELREYSKLVSKGIRIVIKDSELQVKDSVIRSTIGKIEFSKVKLDIENQRLEIVLSSGRLLKQLVKQRAKDYKWIEAINVEESDHIFFLNINIIKEIFPVPQPLKDLIVTQFTISKDGLLIELAAK